MDQKICIDTDITIEIIKDTQLGMNFFNKYKNSEVFISTVSIFELFLREKNLDPIEKLVFNTNIIDFTEACARKAASILKSLKKEGKMIEFRDLFIASTAIVNDCTLATLNIKDFKNIKELKLLEL